MWYSYFNYKWIILIILCVYNFSCFFKNYINENNKTNSIDSNIPKNKLIEENFFVFDSEKLEQVKSHMYGFTISEKGILTDNYYKQLGKYKKPEPQGVYIMIRKIGNKIMINQDFYGNFGLYFYERKDTGYFAISNSFLLLQEYLVGKQNLSFNKDYADNFIISELCSFSIHDTLINEIIQVPSNSYLVINIYTKKIKFCHLKYKEFTVPLESSEGMKIIDKWMDKWVYIIRSLQKQTDNISFDLSGGFDTRTLLTILLNSGINLEDILINSSKDKEHGHDEDLNIAKNISSKLGFKINNLNLHKNTTKWSLEDTIFCTIYSKLGFHKEFYLKNEFYNNPLFSFSGSGGEDLRGYPGYPIKKYIETFFYKEIPSHKEEFYNSSVRILNKSVNILKKDKIFNNDYEISYLLYSKAVGKNHFGKAALEAYMANIFFIQPLMDPDLKKIKYDINGELSHDFVAYIYIRFFPELIKFPFQGNRTLNSESIKKAINLNNKYIPYKKKSNYNNKFFIDITKNISVDNKKDNLTGYEYLKQLFNSAKFINLIKKKYDNKVYNWAKGYSHISKYFPLRHEYGLFAIAVTIENLILNQNYMNSIKINLSKSRKLMKINIKKT